MLKAIEEISTTKKRLKIEIPAERVEEEIQKVLKDIQKKAKIPGFRPGKAPISIIEKKFGKEAESEVLEKLVSQSYDNAIKEAKLKPVLPPIAEDAIDIKRKQPLSFELIVEVRPEIENLNYENIELEEVSTEVKEEEIEDVLKRLSKERGTYEPTEEPIQNEDLVVIDYTTDIGKEAKDFVYKLGAGPFPEEFSKAFEGKRKNEIFNIKIDFPEDSIADFAGKTVNFDITVKEIKRRKDIPYEELPKELGFEDIEDLKKYIKESLERAKKEQAEQKYKIDILKKLLESYDFEIPEGLLEMEIRRLTEEYEAMGLDITQNMDKITESAKRNVKAYLLLEVIGEKEGISVSQEDLKNEVMNIAKKYSISPHGVVQYYMSKHGSLEPLRNSVFENKVFDLLLKRVKFVKKEEAQQ
ncbi:MAG: trigger factor [Thermodesulfovibrio sp.]|uniref:trigger factor n=1 Tax=Thermodesulfovibrio sp. 1176 TaxID=3043424 RepID=UPI002482D8E4|nr:trigger factor [Thermodesulfovibrio sp. 1176]MDI1472072.1 trigger factor [Thermodesulfovibrio sp. 1176]MDI6713760.1 trigger factor [Thermodesulfovibrio sp.]